MSYKTIEAIKNVNLKDLAERALWTFVQTFLAFFIIGLEPIIDMLFTGDWAGLFTITVSTVAGAIAAALSALKTVIVSMVRELKGKVQ